MTRFPVLAAALLLLLTGSLTACAEAKDDASGDAAGGAAKRSYAPDDLVLRLDLHGGFLPAAAAVTALPTMSVYGDGRVITAGPMIEIFPAPALPNLQVQQISTADVAKLVDKAVDAGVGRMGDMGMPAVADAPTTRVMVRTEAGELVTEAPALGIGEEQLGGAQKAARQKLQQLVDALGDLPATLGKGAVGESKPYTAKSVGAVAWKWTEMGADEGLEPQQPQAWTGPALPGAALADFPELFCVSATGDDAGKVLSAAKAANQRTPWTSSGSTWQVIFRPFLPDESACTDLTGK